MQPFSYEKVTNERDALERARVANAAFVAGGTTLVDLMKLNVEVPAALVDINGLPLNQIENRSDGSIRIGALVRNGDLAQDSRIQSRYRVLSQAILAGASAQLRNMATTGGNLMQRTRCYYFRDPVYPCNKRQPGAGCAAMDGYNRIHAILGTSDKCIATHPSDMAVALVALDASVHIRAANGERVVPIMEFHPLPGDTPDRETVIRPGEPITYATLPSGPFRPRSAYVQLPQRPSYQLPVPSPPVP